MRQERGDKDACNVLRIPVFPATEGVSCSLTPCSKCGRKFDLASLTNEMCKECFEKLPAIYCDMHHEVLRTSQKWSYTAQMTTKDASPETFTFCSYECLCAFLVDDEKVLKLKLRRMKVDHAIRHLHGVSMAPTKIRGDPRFDEFKYELATVDGLAKETVEVLDFENMTEEEIKKEFDKEERQALMDAYSDS